MAKVSELLSKPIISIFDAKIVGTIGNIYFDSKMSKGVVLSIFDDNADECEWKFIELSKLACFDSDAAVIRDMGHVSCEWNTRLGSVNPINRPAFSPSGKLLGYVRDIELDGVAVKSFILDNTEIPASTLLSHSNDALVFNDPTKPIKAPIKRKIPKSKSYQRIELHYPKVTELTKEQNDTSPTQPSEQSYVLVPQSNNRQDYVSPVKTNEQKYTSTAEVNSEQAYKFVTQSNSKQEYPPHSQMSSEQEYKFVTQSNSKQECAPHSQMSSEQEYILVKSSSTGEENNVEDENKDNNEEMYKVYSEVRKEEDREFEQEIGLPKLIPQSSTNVSRTPPVSSDVDNKFDFLIGKLLERDIYTSKDELLIRANTLITPEVIALSKKHSRLVQLALHSKEQ